MCINVTHTPFDSLYILIPSYLHAANTADPIYLDQSTNKWLFHLYTEFMDI